MKQALAPVISNSEAMPGTHLIWLESPQIAATARPGQFVMARCGEDTLLRRPLSVHQVDGDKLALLFAIVGRGTQWLSQQQAGDSLDIFGPLGNGFSIYPNSKNLLFVAGGIGIAPIRFLAQEALNQGHSVRLLLGAQTKSQLYPKNLIPSGIELAVITDDGTATRMGRVTTLLPEFTDWADQIFACGPVGMYQAMAQMPELRNKPVQVSLEIMMGCGAGVCYGCTIKTKSGLKQVCQEGPVFDLSELDNINWDELIL